MIDEAYEGFEVAAGAEVLITSDYSDKIRTAAWTWLNGTHACDLTFERRNHAEPFFWALVCPPMLAREALTPFFAQSAYAQAGRSDADRATVPSVSDLFLLSDAKSRSISPENRSGGKGSGARTELKDGCAKGAAEKVGKGWKVNPCLPVTAGKTEILGEVRGSGVINHIWITLGDPADFRAAILRIYWDGENTPSVEVPLADFFASGWGSKSLPLINSAVVAVNPGAGFNSFWQMPFRQGFRMTLENRSGKDNAIFYQIDYSETAVPANAAYFHAQFRMVDSVEFKRPYVILNGVKGKGHYVGTYLGHGARSPGWWGEGEAKFFIDGDAEYPTINGTGEEDYFLGSHNYGRWTEGANGFRETNYSGAYAGFYSTNPLGSGDLAYIQPAERRIGQYRWHILDPIRFDHDLKVTIQNLGWEGVTPKSPVVGEGRYLPLQNYLASVAYWYQTEPHAPFPVLPNNEALRIKPVAPR